MQDRAAAFTRVGLRLALADHLVHDRRGAGERLDVDLDRAACLKPCHQTVVVDDAVISASLMLSRSAGLLVLSASARSYPAFGVPFVEHEQRFGIRLASRTGLAGDADLIEYHAQTIGLPVLWCRGIYGQKQALSWGGPVFGWICALGSRLNRLACAHALRGTSAGALCCRAMGQVAMSNRDRPLLADQSFLEIRAIS